MGNPRASSNLAPGTRRVPFPRGRGTRFLAVDAMPLGNRILRTPHRLRARAGRRGLGNDPDQADAEALLGADLVPTAAVLAADVGAAGVFLQVKDLVRAEQLSALQAFDRGVGHDLGHL